MWHNIAWAGRGEALTFNKYHLAILRKLYYSNCIGERHTSKEDAIKGIAKSEKGEAVKAYDDLKKWQFLQIKKTGYGEHVSIYPHRLQDVKVLLNPDPSLAVRDKPPLEYSIDPDFDTTPFLVSASERGGKYTYHKSTSSPERIKAYVSGEGDNIYSVPLGGFNEVDSLIVRAVKRLDEKFQGRAFERAEMNDLGRDIVGNKQPIKAILDVLLHYKYLIDLQGGYYQRTSKQLPKSDLEDF